MSPYSRIVAWLMPLGLLVAGTAGWPRAASANGPPIRSENAFVTGLNGSAVRSFASVVRRSGPGGELTGIAVPVIVPYQAVDNLLVVGVGMPLVHKTLRTTDGPERTSGLGVGDLLLFSKLNLFQQDDKQETFRVAGKFGLTFPTGATDLSDEGGTLPPPLQRGTGSVNPFATLVATKLWRRFGLNADLGYRALPEANGLDRGDVLRYDVAASFRALPWVYRTYPDHQINIQLELNGSWIRRSRVDGMEVADSGGHLLFASPGLQYIYDTLIVEASVQVPVPGATSLHGTQLSPDWGVLGGIRWLIW